MSAFAIGALSEKAGVKIPTIRYYEMNGLLPAAVRTDTNRRTYDDDTVKRLKFIRHARELGFEVEAIRTLLDLADQPDRANSEADGIARDYVADIENRLARLTALRTELQLIIDRQSQGCIIDVLANY